MDTKIKRASQFPDFRRACCAHLKTLVGGRFEAAIFSPAYSQFPPNAHHKATSSCKVDPKIFQLH